MTLDLVLDALAALLLLGGCALATIGLYGLILKPDIFEQLHVAGLVEQGAALEALRPKLHHPRARVERLSQPGQQLPGW